MNKLAVLYARISPRPDKAAESNLSIPEQFERMRALCVSKGWVVGLEEVDELKSGGSRVGREGFERALSYVCENQATLIVCDLERFARNMQDAVNVVSQIGEAGGKLVSIQEGMDLTTPVGEFVFHVFSALAHLKRRQTADRTRAALQYRVQHDLLASRPDRLPWGKRFTNQLTCPRCKERCGTYTDDMVTVTCARCGRHDRVSAFRRKLVSCPQEMAAVFSLHRLLASHGDVSDYRLAKLMCQHRVANPRRQDGAFHWPPILVKRIRERYPPPWVVTEVPTA